MASQNDKDAQKALFKAIDNTGYDVNKMRSILSQTDLIPDIGLYLLSRSSRQSDQMVSDVVRLFLEKGSDPNNSSTYNPLFSAVSLLKSPQIVRLLLENGADPNLDKRRSQNPLMHSVMINHPMITRLLLEHGADPNDGQDGGGALVKAIQSVNVDLVRLLLDHGADPDVFYQSSFAPLIEAANISYKNEPNIRNRKLEILNLLLERGADPNIQEEHGITALHQPYICTEAIQDLLEHGADPNLEDNDGKTALSSVLRVAYNPSSREPVLDESVAYRNTIALLRAGADPNMGTTPALVYAAFTPSNRIVTALLENPKYPADPNLTNRFGDTALMMAAKFSDDPETVEIVANLLKHGANPNLKNKDGQTALINAARNGYENVASILLQAGADKNVRDNEGNGFVTYIDKLPRLKAEYLNEVNETMMNSRRDMPSVIANEITSFLFKGKKSKKSVKNKKKKSLGKKKKSLGKKKSKSVKKNKKSIRRLR